MNTSLSLCQVALILSMSMSEVSRLVRARQLKPAKVVNKVKYFDVAEVQTYITVRSVQS